jgi:hypothetical protein
MAELDKNLTKTTQIKTQLELEVQQMKLEIDAAVSVVQSLGIDTLKLETELRAQFNSMFADESLKAQSEEELQVTSENILTFMGVIEQKMTEILTQTGNLHTAQQNPSLPTGAEFDFDNRSA